MVQIIAIIQARMGSTRLPGKVLKEVNGRPLLDYLIERVRKAKQINEIIVATTTLAEDDAIEKFCLKNKIAFFRGSSQDVLDRYYQCAKKSGAGIVVRLTADCPLIDPRVIDHMVNEFKGRGYDYVANTLPPVGTYPDGMDVEIFTMEALERAWRESQVPAHREHVTHYFWKTPNFKTHRVDRTESLSSYRLTVDYPEDFEVVSNILSFLYPKNPDFTMENIIEYLNSQPDLKQKNAHILWNQGWEKKTLEK